MVKSLNSHKTLKEVKELQLWKFKNVGAKYGPNHIKSFMVKSLQKAPGPGGWQ